MGLHLGIDADPIGRDGSGNESYLRGVIGAAQSMLRDDDHLYLAGRADAALRAIAGPRTSVVRLPAGLRGDLALGRALTRAGAQIAIGHYAAPVGFSGPIGTVVHDVAYLRVPETYPRALRIRLRAMIPWSLRRSRLVITVSEFSKREIVACYPWVDPERIVVTPNAPATTFFTLPDPPTLAAVVDRYRLPEDFVLAVGNLQPRKNMARLVEATARLDIPLVVAGQRQWLDAAAGIRSASHVQGLGYVPTADLVALYRLCRVFVYPSLYEGFGIPVVEAMAAGAPVVTSRTSALGEVGREAAVLVEPTSVDSLTLGIQRVLTETGLAAQLAEAGARRARDFTWEQSAATLLEAVRQLSAGDRR